MRLCVCVIKGLILFDHSQKREWKRKTLAIFSKPSSTFVYVLAKVSRALWCVQREASVLFVCTFTCCIIWFRSTQPTSKKRPARRRSLLSKLARISNSSIKLLYACEWVGACVVPDRPNFRLSRCALVGCCCRRTKTQRERVANAQAAGESAAPTIRFTL